MMARLLDSSVWVGLLRIGSPRALKEFVSPWIVDADSVLAEPVIFELLRYASDTEAREFRSFAEAFHILQTPKNLWAAAADLGRACRRRGYLIEAVDLLIASIALHHKVELVTFDGDYEKIAKVSDLKVRLLKTPVG